MSVVNRRRPSRAPRSISSSRPGSWIGSDFSSASRDPPGVDVDRGDIVAQVREAGSRRQTHVADADDPTFGSQAGIIGLGCDPPGLICEPLSQL